MLPFTSLGSGSFFAVLELLVDVSTGSGANLRAFGFSSETFPLSLLDLGVVSTGSGANLLGGGEEDIVIVAGEVKGDEPGVKCLRESSCVILASRQFDRPS